MTQTTLKDQKPVRKTAGGRPEPAYDKAWSATDWLIVCAILACAVLLAKVVSAG